MEAVQPAGGWLDMLWGYGVGTKMMRIILMRCSMASVFPYFAYQCPILAIRSLISPKRNVRV